MPKSSLPLKAEKRGVFKLGKVPLSKLELWKRVLEAPGNTDFEMAMRGSIMALIHDYAKMAGVIEYAQKSTHVNGSVSSDVDGLRPRGE